MIKNVKFVVSCQNVNTHAVSTQRSNAEQLPSCEWTAYEILSTIACSFFRLASMKKKNFVSRLQLSHGVISLMNLQRVRLVSILDLVMNRSNLRESPHYTFQGHLSFCIDWWSLLCFLQPLQVVFRYSEKCNIPEENHFQQLPNNGSRGEYIQISMETTKSYLSIKRNTLYLIMQGIYFYFEKNI